MSHRTDSASFSANGTRADDARAPSRRRYAPWTLLACVGVGGAGLLGVDNHESSARAGASLAVQPEQGGGARMGHNALAMVSTAAVTFEPQVLSVKAPAPAPDTNARLENAAEDEAEEDAPRHADPAPAERAAWARRGGPNFPGQTWRDAMNTADWPNVASLIDALPEAERKEPGTRYARALAARELHQCGLALQLLTEIESSLPLLHDEIQAARAHCQLEVGPYEEAYQYFTREQSPDNLISAARACVNGADLARAQQTVDRALSKLLRLGNSKRNQNSTVQARRLRAEIAEARGQGKAAARDWRWLATEAPDHELAEGADATYERLSGDLLSKAQRFERMQTFSLAGNLELALRERSQLAAAPGTPPDELDVTIALAWAYYHSRRDYLKAAELFRKASELSAATRSKYQYYEARALSRTNHDARAIERYTELVERAPEGYYAELAHFRIARLFYELGQWDKAVPAYSRYLERYAQNGGGKYASASRYELAVSRLGAKANTEEAATTLGLLAKKERRAARRVLLTHLEGVALETTRDPKKMLEAIQRYRSVIDQMPISFAALASAARLRALGREEVLEERLQSTFAAALQPSFTPELPEKARLLKELGLLTDAERALFEDRRAVRRKYSAEGRALCELYTSLDRGYRAYSFADHLFRSQELGLAPSADNLWAWQCAYPRPYREVVDAVEERYKLPEWLVYAVMRQESGFRPHVVSPVGAMGLMQLMPNTALRAAEEITAQPGAPWVPDPNRRSSVLDNVELGGFYLAKLLNLLAGQLPVAVAAYNAGPSTVSRWLEAGQDLPADVWVARIPYTETRDYVSLVLGNWLAYRYLDDPQNLPELELALAPGSSAAADCY